MDNVNTRFEVLGDPTRMQILGILSRGNNLRAKDILEHLKISQPTLSHHMQLLTSSKIVSAEKVGRECFYMINEKSILEMKNCILNDPQMKVRDELLYSPKYSGCSACVYGKSRPCVSFCMKGILKEWHAGRLRPERRSVYMHEP